MAITALSSAYLADVPRPELKDVSSSTTGQRPALAAAPTKPKSDDAQKAREAAAVAALLPNAAPPPVTQTLSLRFQVDHDTGKTVVSLLDPQTGDVVRQFPSEESLAIAKALGGFPGVLIDLKV